MENNQSKSWDSEFFIIRSGVPRLNKFEPLGSPESVSAQNSSNILLKRKYSIISEFLQFSKADVLVGMASLIKRSSVKENTSPGEETIIGAMLSYSCVACILRVCRCVSRVVKGNSPLRTRGTQRGKMYERPGFTGVSWNIRPAWRPAATGARTCRPG